MAGTQRGRADDADKQATIAAYEQAAGAYRRVSTELPPVVVEAVDTLAERLGPGAWVLEIGSGGGRDADALAARGLRVRRTDVTPAFVDLLRRAGHDADVLDPLTDDLTDPAEPGRPYDAVWADACLLHVARADLVVVLRRLARATRADGALWLSVKEGDGEGWSTHDVVELPRMFVYWREPALRATLAAAGWHVDGVRRRAGLREEHWLMVTATRGDLEDQ